ncbi:MAG TPA: hypothetical protein VNA19_11680 [Pyrinomonadaceae bacterium]|nr:hypothetical protein [Pyrinomonadaceae bacterium]
MRHAQTQASVSSLLAALGASGKWFCLAVLLVVASARTASAAVDIYQIRGTADFGIYVQTGATDQRLFAGTYPGGSSATLAQRPSDGMLFYVINTANGQIYSYNPATPAVAPVALPNTLGAAVPASFRMAFSPAGTLYYMPDSGVLYTIATTGATAGQATAGPTVTGIGSGGDMAFNSAGTLYAVNSARQLYTVPLGGGAATLLGTITFPGGITPATLGLAFNAANQLLVQTQNPSNLYSVNLTTRAATLVGSLGGGTAATGDLASASVPDPNLSITKTDGVANTYQGATVTYTIVVGNNGAYSVTGTVADTVPAALTGVTWTCAASAGSFCTTASGSGNAISTAATLAPSGTATYTVTGTVSNTATGTLSNTATVAVPSYLTDSATANNTDTDTDTIVSAANISLTKTAATTFVVDNNASYTLTVSNAGPQSASGVVTVSDTLPAVLTYVSASGTGWTCSNSGAVVTCTHAGPLASGNSLPAISLSVGVTTTAAPGVTNTATVSSPTFDPVAADNTGSATTPVLYVKLDKSSVLNTPNAQPGTEITYTIVFTNLGGAAVQSLSVADMIPFNTDFKIGSAAFSYTVTPTVQYSNVARTAADPPPTPNPFTLYTPVGAVGSYDPQVNWVRWNFAGNIPTNATGSVSFTVRIR